MSSSCRIGSRRERRGKIIERLIKLPQPGMRLATQRQGTHVGRLGGQHAIEVLNSADEVPGLAVGEAAFEISRREFWAQACCLIEIVDGIAKPVCGNQSFPASKPSVGIVEPQADGLAVVVDCPTDVAGGSEIVGTPEEFPGRCGRPCRTRPGRRETRHRGN